MDLVQAISEILGFNYTVRLVIVILYKEFMIMRENLCWNPQSIQNPQVQVEEIVSQVEDGKYGSFDKTTQTWNGMIGELQSQKVDFIFKI